MHAFWILNQITQPDTKDLILVVIFVKLLATHQVESNHTLPNQAPITHANHSLVKYDNQYSPTKVSIHARQVSLSSDRLNKARKECSASCHTGKESQGCT